MSANKRNFLVGITVLAGILIFGWMFLQFGAKTPSLIGFAPPQTLVEIDAPRVDGLSEGSGLTYQGVVVGRVTRLARNPDGNGVKISAMLQTDPPVPTNIHADIVMTNLIGGGTSVALELQKDKNGQDQSPQMPPAGSKYPVIPALYVGLKLNILPSEYGQTMTEISNLAQAVTTVTQDVHNQKLVDHIDAAVLNVSEQATEAGKVLKSIEDLIGDPSVQSDLRQAVANARKASDDLAKFSAGLPHLSDQASGVLTDAQSTLQHAQARVDEVSRQLTASLAQASTLIDNLHSISQKIDNGQGTAGLLVNDPKLYQALVEDSRELNTNLLDLQRLVEQWEQEGLSLKVK